MTAKDQQLERENQRRAQLNKQRRNGLSSSDPAERAKWQARDEAWKRQIGRLP